MPPARAILIGLACLALLNGCATVSVPETKQESESSALAGKLQALSSRINAAEAQRAADAAVRYPLQLAREWDATPPAIYNNMLVNAGIHPRGLCFQWADALTAKLMSLDLRTLEIHRGVAKLGTRREHSSVVLTAPGQDFTNGIALDAWRHCGRLNWSPVTGDKYAWQEVDLTPSYQKMLLATAKNLAAQSRTASPAPQLDHSAPAK